MDVRLLFPRLDCSFKPGHVPRFEGPPNNPVRKHYLTFRDSLAQACEDLGHNLSCITAPLWRFEESHTRMCDVVLIPHRQRYEFDLPHAKYYMQMGIPELFSIDSMGWCADSSMYPIQPASADSKVFDYYKKRIENNESKFPQPDRIVFGLPETYVFFACQLPHDTVITNHSDVTAAQGLQKTFDWALESGMPVIVKPHPINLAAMDPLRAVFLKNYRHGTDQWIQNISIHQAIKGCEAFFTVNSGGTGLEAILHEKPIFRFGRADYDSVSFDANNGIDWDNKDSLIPLYKDFMASYVAQHYRVNEPTDFYKLFKEL